MFISIYIKGRVKAVLVVLVMLFPRRLLTVPFVKDKLTTDIAGLTIIVGTSPPS